ncbi:Zn-dependent protease [Orenia metallireducens]|uniref:Zn-dependent protease (Includes SpoIVFB) n=1 Tax=Orenia metallireducens TaxID=1413210 RepID=A0A285HK60_9FIRM|nr:site-2 protease family protein [Orenia metallireducens]PRX26676.1 Zn-dependent protease [Orenia metallireducens]SNY36034.1 Zn-dependent protease (includes SpoIVFB) [Orenia metallireducens]
MNTIAELVLLIPILLLSLSFHEYAHGKMADLLGDPTPKMTGRLTLNPLAHLDPMGTLVLLITRRFGWAKPVQVNPRYFKDRKKGMMLVGLAGPLSNITLAIGFAFLYRFVGNFFYTLIDPRVVNTLFITGIYLNLGLAVFNLLPVPPLDGSKILAGLLPASMNKFIYNLEAYGPFILLFLLFTNGIGVILSPAINILRIGIFKLVGLM